MPDREDRFRIMLDMVEALTGPAPRVLDLACGTGTTSEEEAEAATRQDISVFPLAMPLIAGPGSISATILLVTSAQGDQLKVGAVVVALLIMLGLTYLALLAAIPMQKLLGLTGLAVVSRVVGVLLAALSVQFIFDGIKASGLLHG